MAKHSKFRALGALGLLLTVSVASWASPVTMREFSFGHEAIDTSMSGWVGVGQFVGTIDQGAGASKLLTFCTDIYQPFSWGKTSDYSRVENGSALGFTAKQADLLGRLYTEAGAIDSTTKSVAFQLSIWEILYDTDNSLSLTSGNFALDSGGSTAVRQQAAAWLTGLSGISTSYQVQRLYNAYSQDFIVAKRGSEPSLNANQIPEPASWALGLTALAAMALVRRQTRKA